MGLAPLVPAVVARVETVTPKRRSTAYSATNSGAVSSLSFCVELNANQL